MPFNPPIQPSPSPPVYCTECGCEVYPPAWLCATCGKALHEPGAMTTSCPYARPTSKNSKPDRILGARIFAILVVVLFFILDIVKDSDWIPHGNSRQDFGLGVMSLLIVIAFFWVVLSDNW
ncbi:MAG: hypothetical protein ABSC48_03155 [Terracidiphilus sp.]|jgi:hypothetical protein